MSEKRFTYGETIDYNFFDVFEEKKYLGMVQRDSTKIVDRLNEQQATIEALILDRNNQEEKLDIARRNMTKQLEKISEQQATIEHLTKSRDKWRELSNSFLFYCKCYEKAIERAFEEKPYPTEDDINRIYAELEKELEDE